jgi:preprotein translocase subunit SecF
MTAIAIWSAVSGFAKRIPWQVWAGIALLAAFWFWGNHRYNEGVDDTDAKWVEAGKLMESQAEDAADAADALKEARDNEFADEQSTIQEEVDNVKTDDNAGPGVAKYFDSLRAAKERSGGEATR